MNRLKWLLLFCGIGVLGACGVDSVERNNAGNTLYSQGDYTAALEAYQAAQVANPDIPEYYFNAANALTALDELDAAAASLEQALLVEDENLKAEIYYNLGNVYFQQERYTEAVDSYRETLLRHPDDGDARHNLELALLKIVAPTPTAIEQKTEQDEGESDPEATPTNNPSAQGGPTATPLILPDLPDPEALPTVGKDEIGTANSPTTPRPSKGGELTVEDAISLLDTVKHDQETLRPFFEEDATLGTPSPYDW